MSPGKKMLLILLLLCIPASLLWVRHLRRQTVKLVGAVITQNEDPRKQLPVPGVHITANDGVSVTQAVSDSSGLFAFRFRKRLLSQHPSVKLTFAHPDYKPLELTEQISTQIIVAAMAPIPPKVHPAANVPQQSIGNPVVRYSIKTATEENVGSMVRPFEVVNQGNVPCNGHPPCSPDGRWKASSGGVTLDAGAGNQFRNARASCIAGPCPFTRIDASGLENPGRYITVSATAWSDTATFLVETEVVHPMISDIVRNLYPVIFGTDLNFTLPPAAEGVSIQADLNGQSIVFPIGPALILSWAQCTARSNPDDTRVFRCELKPGYRWSRPAA
jgi:hypothetical protein